MNEEMKSIICDVIDQQNKTNSGRIPDGQYICAVKNIEKTVSRTSKNEMFVIAYTIIDGPFSGRDTTAYYVIKDDWRVKAFKKQLEKLCNNNIAFKRNPELIIGLKVLVEIKTRIKTDGTRIPQPKVISVIAGNNSESVQ